MRRQRDREPSEALLSVSIICFGRGTKEGFFSEKRQLLRDLKGGSGYEEVPQGAPFPAQAPEQSLLALPGTIAQAADGRWEETKESQGILGAGKRGSS